MAKFLVLYLAPHAVVDEWMKTPPEKRKAEEEKMMSEWKKWMAPVGKTAGVSPERHIGSFRPLK